MPEDGPQPGLGRCCLLVLVGLATLAAVGTPLYFVASGVWSLLYGPPFGWVLIPIGLLLGGFVTVMVLKLWIELEADEEPKP